jgi:hypothetical protein
MTFTSLHPQYEPEIPLAYMETTIPPGMTIVEYTRLRPRLSRWERVKRVAGLVA